MDVQELRMGIFKAAHFFDKQGSLLIDPERMREMDLTDGREDKKVTADNVLMYLDRHKSVYTKLADNVSHILEHNAVQPSECRDEAIRMLGMMDTERHVRILTILIEHDPSWRRRILAFKALANISKQNTIFLRGGWTNAEALELINIFRDYDKPGLYEFGIRGLETIIFNKGKIFGYQKMITDEAKRAYQHLQIRHSRSQQEGKNSP